MSTEQQQLSPWITQWQTTGTPEWATLLQTGHRVAKMIQHWFDKHATVEELLEKQKHGVSETFDAAIEAKFPGAITRMNNVLIESARLRSFDPATKEDLAAKHSDDTLAYKVLWDANDGITAARGNEVFGALVFDVPEVTETHDDTPETSAPTSYKRGG